MKKTLLILLLYASVATTSAQLVYNNGAAIYSQQNALIKVEGSIQNDNNGLVDHNGLIIVDSSYIQNNNATSQGNGIYEVYVNWDNSANFIHGTSHVKLTGGSQLITGSNITDFYDLTLQGPGVKTQTINAETSNILDLKANELATNDNEMFVSNNSTSAIIYDNTFNSEGFVSSTGTGRLTRATNQSNEYVYPLGSNVGTRRFRAIYITPNSTAQNQYSAILNNYNATTDAYQTSSLDTNLCTVNDLFYHKIERKSGVSAAAIKVSYINGVDGSWSSTANWNNAIWNNNNLNQQNTGNYYNIENINYDFDFAPIILGQIKPNAPVILSDSAICSTETNAIYEVTSVGNYSYNWSAPGGTITSGQGTNQINVNWNGNTTGIVEVIITDPLTSCSSNNGTFTTNFYPNPIAGISASYPNLYPGTIINLNDSSTGEVAWNWDFGNTYNSTNENTQTVYNSPGTYLITLVVENEFGCLDSTTYELTVGGKVVIPNVFTPNNDGSNDYFEILGLEKYNIVILNRWGQTLFTGNENTTFWDGTTPSGENVPEGTYFFVLTADNLEEKGALTLFR
ncbi:MAG: gliding motility-associated C-terminal domain-containing protein [Flavobacteriales bacterium]|nr:gliding motility-associated C-terminal domain-containing protein [Flavobacteriales bacterium]